VSGRRILVACVGNIFLGDDGFGVEVGQQLAQLTLPEGVQVKDFGIGGVHLAYDLMDGCELLVLVDAAARGVTPGTVSVIEVDSFSRDAVVPVIDAHGLGPDEVFALLDRFGSRPSRTIVVACEPADLEPGIGLSDPVRAAIPVAVRVVADILQREAPRVQDSQSTEREWSG